MLHFSCPSCGAAASAPKECVGRTTSCRSCGKPITVPKPAPTPRPSPPAAGRDRTSLGKVISHAPTQMKPAADVPKTSNRTQAKPSPRSPQHVGPARRTARALASVPPPKKRNFALVSIVFMGALLFVLAAGGLFGFGVYRYLDAQRPKDDNRELARAPLDLGDPIKTPPAVTPRDGVNAATEAPAKAYAPLPPNADPKPEAIDPRPARPPTPPPADEPPPPKKEPPPNPPDKADTPTPKPEVPPIPKPVDGPKPPDNPGPKPVESPDRSAPTRAAAPAAAAAPARNLRRFR